MVRHRLAKPGLGNTQVSSILTLSAYWCFGRRGVCVGLKIQIIRFDSLGHHIYVLGNISNNPDFKRGVVRSNLSACVRNDKLYNTGNACFYNVIKN